MEALEDGVRRVTDWILGAGESMLIRQQEVGYDISSAEDLRQAHNAVELQCRVSFGWKPEEISLTYILDALFIDQLRVKSPISPVADYIILMIFL